MICPHPKQEIKEIQIILRLFLVITLYNQGRSGQIVSGMGCKEIQIILRLFLVIAMYCQASSSRFNQSLNLPHC